MWEDSLPSLFNRSLIKESSFSISTQLVSSNNSPMVKKWLYLKQMTQSTFPLHIRTRNVSRLWNSAVELLRNIHCCFSRLCRNPQSSEAKLRTESLQWTARILNHETWDGLSSMQHAQTNTSEGSLLVLCLSFLVGGLIYSRGLSFGFSSGTKAEYIFI